MIIVNLYLIPLSSSTIWLKILNEMNNSFVESIKFVKVCKIINSTFYSVNTSTMTEGMVNSHQN